MRHVTSTWRYGELTHFSDDDLISHAVAAYGEWAFNECQFIARMVDLRGGCYFDVGAHIGTTVLAVSSMAQCECIAFEPLGKSFELLRTNAEKSGLPITCENSALGARPGRAIVASTSRNNTGMTSFVALGSESDSSTSVPMRLLDEFVSGGPGVLKIDVEGAALAVLQGGSSTLNVHRPSLLIEVNSLSEALPVWAYLRELDFECFAVIFNPFNRDNFNRARHNFLAGGREVSLFAHPAELSFESLPYVKEATSIRLKSADHIVAALSRKPQYMSKLDSIYFSSDFAC